MPLQFQRHCYLGKLMIASNVLPRLLITFAMSFFISKVVPRLLITFEISSGTPLIDCGGLAELRMGL